MDLGIEREESEDLALREKEDFIDQLNSLLEHKTSIANLNLNTRKYKELVDCLSKMEKIDNQIERKGNKKGIEMIATAISEAPEDEEELQNKYSSIIEEVKNILNGKFREGYSHRIRNMLDKFEIVFKNDQLKRVERKHMVNMREEGSQVRSHSRRQRQLQKLPRSCTCRRKFRSETSN